MARRKRSKDGSQQLPLLCEQCGGPVTEQRSEAQVVFRCEACAVDLVTIPLSAPRDGEEPPLLQIEQALLDQISSPARALYEYLRRYAHRHGYAPSLREMQLAMGWSSVNTASHHLKQLEEIGLIERDYATTRGIRLPHAA